MSGQVPLFTASVEGGSIIIMSREKGFREEPVKVLCLEDQNNRQRQLLSHATAHSQPPGSSPCPPSSLFNLKAQPGLTPQQVLGTETKGVAPQHGMTIPTLSAMFSLERLVTVCKFSFY